MNICLLILQAMLRIDKSVSKEEKLFKADKVIQEVIFVFLFHFATFVCHSKFLYLLYYL